MNSRFESHFSCPFGTIGWLFPGSPLRVRRLYTCSELCHASSACRRLEELVDGWRDVCETRTCVLHVMAGSRGNKNVSSRLRGRARRKMGKFREECPKNPIVSGLVATAMLPRWEIRSPSPARNGDGAPVLLIPTSWPSRQRRVIALGWTLYRERSRRSCEIWLAHEKCQR
jgi:hypothetical protein